MARILLVDDDPAVRGSLLRFLEREGHDVGEARDGREAVEAVGRGSWDLVITDVNMPEMSGIEVLMAVRESSPEIPVIAISGGGLLDKAMLLDDAGALGAVATIEKPVELDELRRLVEGALARGDR